MRFSRLSIRRFGRLRALELELDPRIALVFGPNEAGKSTIKEALETVLFGFHPASDERHPLRPWDEDGGLELAAELVLDSGQEIRVERTLRSAATARRAPRGADLGPRGPNRQLEELAGAERALYRLVYSLGIDDLKELDREGQARVDHLLLPSVAAPVLRPVHVVLAKLEEDQGLLWRSDNRGKPLARALRAELREAREALRAAREREEALRSEHAARALLEQELESARARRSALAKEESEAPRVREHYELEERARALPPPADLSALGRLPLADPAAVRAELATFEQRLAPPRARIARPPVELLPADQLVLSAADELRARFQEAAAEATHAAHAAALEEDLAEARRRLDETLARLLARAPVPGDLAALRKLPLAAQRAAEEWRAALQEPARRNPLQLLTGIGIGLVVALLAVLDVLPRVLALIGLGVSAIALALVLLVRQRSPERRRMPATARELCGRLPLARELCESPAGLRRLADGIERLEELSKRLDAGALRLADLGAQRAAHLADLRSSCARLGLDPEGAHADLVERLDAALRGARWREAAARADAEERRAAEARIAELDELARARREHLARLQTALAANVPDEPDPARAFARLVKREEERRALLAEERRLRARPEAEAFARRARECLGARPETLPFAPAVSAARAKELERLDERIDVLARRLGEIAARLEQDPGGAEARARERCEELEQRIAEVERSRDRLALLAVVLARAEREHKEAHQPDVLRRASEYLAGVTEGRYTRLDVSPEDGQRLRVTTRRGVTSLVGPPLSRGTRDQIQLCLRLGLLDHLDEGRESLPLVLDEVLVNCDDARRPAIYPLLAHAAERRQIVLLTCHAHFAAEAEQAFGVERIALG